MKTIKYIENTIWVRKGAGMYACEYDIDGNDERNTEVLLIDFLKLAWISWEDAVRCAKWMGLKKFTLDEIERITIDEDGEIIERKIVGYHNPSHAIRIDHGDNTYSWMPMIEVVL